MRLLHTSTYEMVEVVNTRGYPYAILSHRWEGKEPTYQDYRDNIDRGLDGELFRKVRDACRFAKRRNLPYIWIDTICIDKTSSAELSEAINSMFQWYRGARVCCAYLSDVILVDSNTVKPGDTPELDYLWPSFRHSAWFTRGWTLQELLAPYSIEFFDASWTRITTKRDSSRLLQEITGIDLTNWSTACIAQKMSWAARRTTTRPEDMAYSLLGVFDINMPLLYGEGGRKAFLRLQKEIIASSDDESIFAWIMSSRFTYNDLHGLLAPEPSSFIDSADVSVRQSEMKERLPYTITNKGIHLQFPALREIDTDSPGTEQVTINLNAWKPDAEGESRPVQICLWNMGFPRGWIRQQCLGWHYGTCVHPSFGSDGRALVKSIYVKQKW